MITLEAKNNARDLIKVCANKSCKNSDSTLLKCSRCKSQWYCGVECQKIDWPQHKKICQVVNGNKESKSKEIKKPISEDSIAEKPMPIPGLRLIENFISDDLHERFIQQMDKGIPETNDGHYDGYNFNDYEAFDRVFYELIKDVFSKLKKINVFSSEKSPLKLACTLIGYEKDGFINKHIDSPLLSGGTVVIISFNSPVVVNFYSQKKTEQQQHKIFIPPKSMYTTSGEARYDWSHEILKDETSYNSVEFTRARRYAIVLTPPGPLYSGSELLEY